MERVVIVGFSFHFPPPQTCRQTPHCIIWSLLSTCQLHRQQPLSEKLLLIPNSPSVHLFCCQCLSLMSYMSLMLQHIRVHLLLTMSCSVSPPFSLPLSVGMRSCWRSSTVEPVSSQALWCFLCWASWLQSKAWTSVR